MYSTHHRHAVSENGRIATPRQRGSARLLRLCVFLSLSVWLMGCGGRPGEKPDQNQHELSVELVNVKVVDGKYRYFCSIQNIGTTPFSGSVKIESINKKGELVGGEHFTTTTPIEPGLRRVVYFDQNTGPPDVHGDYGIATFRITVE
jgi:hypothetical protein